ncbi:polysaccharide deacetylase family protein [Candidatus Woesearchaeota archaeon]|nr:polysaccharide deacetylase family protein [Candidatus Woesearchaeota archaeon]
MKLLITVFSILTLIIIYSGIMHFTSTAPKTVLLSFDVELGDSPEQTMELLSTLKDFNISATFFILGKFAEKYPEIVQTIAENHEIACHSYSHPKFPFLSEDEKISEVRKCKSILENITGRPVVGFRAPYLLITGQTLKVLIAEGFDYDSSVIDNFPFMPKDNIEEIPVSSNFLVPLMDYNYFYVIRKPSSFFYHLTHARKNSVSVVDMHIHVIMTQSEDFNQSLNILRSGNAVFWTMSDYLEARA